MTSARVSGFSALRRLNMTLLLCFDSLMQTRSVTATAHALNKSQPAISRELAQLRESLADPLFVVIKKRLVPTERAIRLHNNIHEPLCTLEQALSHDDAFNPLLLTGAINIGAAAHIELLLAAPLTLLLRAAAPNLTVRFQPVHGDFVPDDLDFSRMDIAIGLFQPPPKRFRHETLFDDERVCVVSSQHPLASRNRLTLHDLPKMKWLAFSHMYGAETNFDRALRNLHQEMHFSVYVSNFGLAPTFLMESDYATTMPRRIANKYQKYFPLRQIILPKELRKARMVMVWSIQKDQSKLNRWIRDAVVKVISSESIEALPVTAHG